MPEKREPRKKGWGEEAKLIEPTVLYMDASDKHGHRGWTKNIAIPPWLKDAASDAMNRNPGYEGKLANVFRDFLAVGAKVRLHQLDDVDADESVWKKSLQIYFDQAEQAWELQQYAAMGQYVTSCESILRVYVEAKNWMRVTKHLEKMRQRVDEGHLMEPHLSAAEELIKTYSEMLKAAKVE